MKPPRTADPIKIEARKARALRRVGCGARCACGEARPEALIAGSQPMICAACDRTARGQSLTDAHHVAGRANNDFTTPIPVNDHRAELSTAQMEWSRTLRVNPNRSPLIAAAAGVRGFMETLINMIKRVLGWIPDTLEAIDKWLTEKLGPNWFVGIPGLLFPAQ